MSKFEALIKEAIDQGKELSEIMHEMSEAYQSVQDEYNRKRQQEAEKVARMKQERENALNTLAHHMEDGTMSAADLTFVIRQYIMQQYSDLDQDIVNYLLDTDTVDALIKEIEMCSRVLMTVPKAQRSKVFEEMKMEENKATTVSNADTVLREFINSVIH